MIMYKDDVLNQFGGKDWDYSVLSKIAKQSGGAKEFAEKMYNNGSKAGFVAGVLAVGSLCALGAIIRGGAVAVKFGMEKYKEHKLKEEIENISYDVNENDDNGVEK